MHPWTHAQQSVLRFGGKIEDTLKIHHWFDASKIGGVFYTHRMYRHHREGIQTAVEYFGTTLPLSGGGNIDVALIGQQHCIEDCNCVPTASEWLAHMETPEWMPKEIPSSDELAEWSSKCFGGRPADYHPLHEWFYATKDWHEEKTHLAMRHHAFGAFEAEEVFGIVLHTTAGTIPVRYLAERHIRRVLGRIPSSAQWMKRIKKGAAWMADVEPRSKPLRPI